jgi:formate dehydrogenase accessory protein FdhE
MTAAQLRASDFDARIRRAQHLAELHPFASEILSFYRHLAMFQKRLYAELSKTNLDLPSSAAAAPIRSQGNLILPLQLFPDLLFLLESVGTPPVVRAARQLSSQGSSAWSAFLDDYWDAEDSESGSSPDLRAHQPQPVSEALNDFILRVFSEPCAEFLAARRPAPPLAETRSTCPLCDSHALLGVLRPEGDGGKRMLVCSFCLYEWEFRRILCPACGEEAENKLPVYVAEQFPHVRVEACDTCNFYIRSVDLTKDGHAVPLVDDLAGIPLSFWAQEHNYIRLRPNLLGT